MTPTPVEVPYRTRAGSWRTFCKRYDPVIKADGSLLHGWMEVKDLPTEMVWTVVEAENKWYAMPGFLIVNRIDYLVGQKPWSSMESYCPGYLYG